MSKPRNLVVGVRSFTGSRTSLICAAEELLAASPVIKRATGASASRAYLDPEEGPGEFVSAGFSYRSALPVEQLAGLLHAVEERLADPARPEARSTVRLDLLWVAGVKMKTPGLTLPSPAVARKRWAIDALVEGGEDEIVESIQNGDEDKGTGRTFSVDFKHIGGSPVWSGGVKDFKSPTIRRSPEAVTIESEAVDMADVVAVCADLMAFSELDWERRARPGAKPESDDDAAEYVSMALDRIVPEDVLPVAVPLRPGATDEQRVLAWIAGVRAALASHQAAYARSVVFHAGPDQIRGAVLVRKAAPGGPVFHREAVGVGLKPAGRVDMSSIDIALRTRDLPPPARAPR